MMSKESFKQELKAMKHNARARGIARTLDMRAAYSSRYIDTSMHAAALAIQHDGLLVRRDIKKVVPDLDQPTKKRL